MYADIAGANRPRSEGPSRMPAITSPMTGACPTDGEPTSEKPSQRDDGSEREQDVEDGVGRRRARGRRGARRGKASPGRRSQGLADASNQEE